MTSYTRCNDGSTAPPRVSRTESHTARLERADSLKSMAWGATVRGDHAERERLERDLQRERDIACAQNEVDAADGMRLLRLVSELYPSQFQFLIADFLEAAVRKRDAEINRRFDALEKAVHSLLKRRAA